LLIERVLASDDRGVLMRFVEEAQITAKREHPNLIVSRARRG